MFTCSVFKSAHCKLHELNALLEVDVTGIGLMPSAARYLAILCGVGHLVRNAVNSLVSILCRSAFLSWRLFWSGRHNLLCIVHLHVKRLPTICTSDRLHGVVFVSFVFTWCGLNIAPSCIRRVCKFQWPEFWFTMPFNTRELRQVLCR